MQSSWLSAARTAPRLDMLPCSIPWMAAETSTLPSPPAPSLACTAAWALQARASALVHGQRPP